jgi:hypothetical protein
MDGEHGHGAPETGSISLPTIGFDVNLDASSSVPPQGGISDGGDVLHVSLNGASALLGSDTGASANSPSTLLSINADADTGSGGADIGSTLITKLFATGPSALAHVQVGDAPSAPQAGDGADIGANIQVGLGDTAGAQASEPLLSAQVDAGGTADGAFLGQLLAAGPSIAADMVPGGGDSGAGSDQSHGEVQPLLCDLGEQVDHLLA